MEQKENISYQLKVQLCSDEVFFGPGIATLLETIDRTESMSEACRNMEMAYSKGWKIIKRAEEKLGFKLVIGVRGGVNGGKMKLTEEGSWLLKQYRKFEREMNQYARQRFDKIFK